MSTEEFISQSLAPRFNLGVIQLSPSFFDAYGSWDIVETRAHELMCRHAIGDWGDIGDEDAGKNNIAAAHKGQLMSEYSVGAAGGEQIKVWVITDPGHATTTMLLPSEY